MLLTIRQIANLINYTTQGTRKLILRLGIPTVKGKYQTNTNDPFALSIRLQHQYNQLKVLYSIQQLATLMGKDKKTILLLLTENDVPLRGKHKKYVFCWDARKYLGNNS